MSKTCILTDSSVIFQQPTFPGHEHVFAIPFYIQIGKDTFQDTADEKVCRQFLSKTLTLPVRVHSPSVNDFCQIFHTQRQKYSTVLAILSSASLFPVYQNALQAVDILHGAAQIHVIDSQTVAAGLGFIIEAVAAAAHQNANAVEIKSLVRALIPHTYTLLCLQSLSVLSKAGYLDPAQAIVGEMLGIVPLYILESGCLVPILKARSTRHLIDMFHEFVLEFEDLRHISVVKGLQPFDQETKNLRDRLSQTIPLQVISEHEFSPALNATFGPRSLGIFALERFI